MKRNRRNNNQKERIVMIASSVFVLAALTATGMYMQSKNDEPQDDGYTLDFTALENNVEDKYQEIAQNDGPENNSPEEVGDQSLLPEQGNMEDDLDYLPMEAGSSLIQIPGLTDDTMTEDEDLLHDGVENNELDVEKPERPVQTEKPAETESPAADQDRQAGSSPDAQTPDSGEEAVGQPGEEAAGQNVVITNELHFSAESGLLRPLEGETLVPYSMDGSIHFTTLDQYKYNPALMIQAAEGTEVRACAEGRVVSIFQDSEIGHAVRMDLGDGYELIYGQLQEINVQLGSYVSPGEVLGVVAAPTKYFKLEGSNLYLKLTQNGVPVNPETLFR